jgi:hypothetical protein
MGNPQRLQHSQHGHVLRTWRILVDKSCQTLKKGKAFMRQEIRLFTDHCHEVHRWRFACFGQTLNKNGLVAILI